MVRYRLRPVATVQVELRGVINERLTSGEGFEDQLVLLRLGLGSKFQVGMGLELGIRMMLTCIRLKTLGSRRSLSQWEGNGENYCLRG
jgi:hypothetical protein